MMRFGLEAVLKRMKGYSVDTIQALIKPEVVRFRDVWPRIDRVEGFLVPGQEEWLFRTARSLPDGARIVEIGGYKGRSTVCLAYGCVGSRRHVFTIDRFKGVYQDIERSESLRDTFESGFFDEWRANVEVNGLLEYVTPLMADSREIARIWAAPIHMLFIDGSHKFEDVVADFAGFYPHIVPNGVVALHDVTPSWEGAYRAWHEYAKHYLQNHGALSTLAHGRKLP